jgi:tetratricopeptide (TPR) repeat protein
MRDNIHKSNTRIASLILTGNLDQALADCEAAEKQFGYYWITDLLRSFIFRDKFLWREAENALKRITLLHPPTSYLCPSNIVPFYLGYIAYIQGKCREALSNLDPFLQKYPNDISALYIRATVAAELWKQNAQPLDLENAIADFQKAYQLLDSLPDNEVCVCQVLRFISEAHPDETKRQRQDFLDASLIWASRPQFGNTNAAVHDQEADARRLLGTVDSADLYRVNIGCQMGECLAAVERNEECLALLTEILPLFQKTGGADFHAYTLSMLATLHLQEWRDRNDRSHLGEAEYLFHRLLILSGEHRLDDETISEIQTLKTDIDNARRETS